MGGAPTIRPAAGEADLRAAFPVMRELRAGLTDADAFVARVRRAEAGGYRLLLAEHDGEITGVLGYRLIEDLAWGRSFYIDDLVVTARRRGGGEGAALMAHAVALAREAGCEAVRLCSGLSRTDAHRFYERLGMTKTSFAFRLPL